MNVRRISVVLMFLVMAVAGCASMKVQTDFDQLTDFNAYRTFGWLPAHRWRQSWYQQRNAPIDRHIRRKTAELLEARGIREASGGQPDLWIVYYAGVKDELDVSTLGYEPAWNPPDGGAHIERYKLGTLVLDLIDVKRDSLVWRGHASGAMYSPEEAPAHVERALARLLADFPPVGNKP